MTNLLQRPAERWIRRLGGLLLVIAIVIATLLMIEGAASVALFWRDYATATEPNAIVRPHTEHDTLLGWVNRPSFSSPDEYGRGIGLTTTPERFRGRSPLGTLVSGRVRVICSGDSFTMGVGVGDEDNWCRLLERTLPGLETVNMGQGAYGVDQAYLWYRRDGVRVRHQIQILGLTDVQFERSLTGTYSGRFKPYFELDGDRLVTRNVPVPHQTMAALRRAYAARLVEELRVVQVVRRIPRFDGRQRGAEQVMARWALFERIFDDLAALHRANGTQLVIAYLPTGRNRAPGYLDARRRRLADYATRRGLTFVDLTPSLRKLSADSLDLTFISRIEPGVARGVLGHYSVYGNAWVARELVRTLGSAMGRRPLSPPARAQSR